METHLLILLGVGCVFGAVAGFIFCCCAITVLNPPPRQNTRAHHLGRRLGWSGAVRQVK